MTIKGVVLVLLLLFACSDKSKDSFELGKRAYNSGKFIEARTLFLQVDSVGTWSGQAKKYLLKIDSLSILRSAIQPETQTQENVYTEDEYFTDKDLLLDTSQYQLIDRTCALYLNTADERRGQKERFAAIQDSIEQVSRSSDSSENSSEGEQEGSDDGMWYQYKYEEQFETLKELGIPKVRVQNKLHVRFIDRNKKMWTLVNKEGVFYDDGIVLFNVNKRPMHLHLTDFGSDEIRRYFSKK